MDDHTLTTTPTASDPTQAALGTPPPVAAPATGTATPCTPPTADAEYLRRMRAGDRGAAAEFLNTYWRLIRRRVRGKLGSGMRRMFDSQDVLSTISRRLDAYVRSGRMRAATEAELWALVNRITEVAIIDRVKAYHRLRQAEGPDGPMAQALLDRLERADRAQAEGAGAAPGAPGGAEVELGRVLDSLPSEDDRELLALWLSDVPLFRIAQMTGRTPAAVRQRWKALRERLRSMIESGVL